MPRERSCALDCDQDPPDFEAFLSKSFQPISHGFTYPICTYYPDFVSMQVLLIPIYLIRPSIRSNRLEVPILHLNLLNAMPKKRL